MNRNVDINLLASLNLPVLCLDTCVFLDLIRDVTRDSILVHNIKAGVDLLSKAEANNSVIVLMAEQVKLELSDNEQSVEDELTTSLSRFKSRVKKVSDIVSAFGFNGELSIDNLDGHVSRAKNILERWKRISYLVPQNTAIVNSAYRRVSLSITPARKGKDSMKDCVVTETYLDISRELRELGLTAPIVFSSSNTKDYFISNKLADDLATDFSRYGIQYSTGLGEAKHLLGV
ncbi:hypothetical protein BV924_02655 [Pectobacterium odoriferum]|uniref:DUF4935 domain-containing protein n=1 Tax=Pectobacterium odoriferum TaxID=78398 RepID=A0ABD6VVC6_9GAMM|nr:PIN domain-containing protein [Pectobacterium odoriferum]POD96799.1 hypothetical protein BVY06_05595 [Pectobacterium odoriferum]POE15689.1 hypothetical protein BV924_02655 [Pectobacterium odoriferum]POE29227.1 hypothetical protein BV926_02650 [Pectobacterium odoriferum]POE34575.1 hypothetical protein BV919_02650 [Pectobacterium odoriferum]